MNQANNSPAATYIGKLHMSLALRQRIQSNLTRGIQRLPHSRARPVCNSKSGITANELLSRGEQATPSAVISTAFSVSTALLSLTPP